MEHVTILRYEESAVQQIEDTVITEMRLSINLPNGELIGIMAIPEALDKLTVGYLFGERIIRRPDDIKHLTVDTTNSTVSVELADRVMSDTSLTISSSRAILGNTLKKDDAAIFITTHVKHHVAELLLAANQLSSVSTRFQKTGAVHTAGLWLTDSFLWIYDDIGRHNAVDKVIGHALLEMWPIPEQAILVSTGRISSDIVMKLTRANIPILVSRSAPTGMAIQLAQQHGLTLIGFARGNRCNIYAHAQRITFN